MLYYLIAVQGEHNFIKILSMVIMGIWNSINTDSKVSPTQMVFGCSTRLLVFFMLDPEAGEVGHEGVNNQMAFFNSERNKTEKMFIPKDLITCKQVNRANLSDFLKYVSTLSGEEMVSFKKYVSRMKEKKMMSNN